MDVSGGVTYFGLLLLFILLGGVASFKAESSDFQVKIFLEGRNGSNFEVQGSVGILVLV